MFFGFVMHPFSSSRLMLTYDSKQLCFENLICSMQLLIGTTVATQDATATCHGCVVSGTLRGKTQASCKATIEKNTKITGSMPSSGTLHLTLMNSCDWWRKRDRWFSNIRDSNTYVEVTENYEDERFPPLRFLLL